jgi:hypothetical protein
VGGLLRGEEAASNELLLVCVGEEDKQGQPVFLLPALIPVVSSWTLTLIEKEDDTSSWGNFLVYFSHNIMST